MADSLLCSFSFSLASLWVGTVGIGTPNGSTRLFGCFSRLSFFRSFLIARPQQLTRTRVFRQPCILHSAIMECSRRPCSWRRPQTALSSTFRAPIFSHSCPATITCMPAGWGSGVTSRTSATAANLPKRLLVTVKCDMSRLSCTCCWVSSHNLPNQSLI
jgi:hypothetical protein